MLAMNGAERQPSLPDVPTFAEAGFPDLDIYAIVGIAVPGGTPPEVKTAIYEAFKSVITDPDFINSVAMPNGYEPIASSPEEFDQFIHDETPATKHLIDSLGVSLSQ